MSVRALESDARVVRQETQGLILDQCIEQAVGRAARRIPHLDRDCLRAILQAHVETRLDQFRGDAPLEHWVNRVLRNKVSDLVRFENGARRDDARSLSENDEAIPDPACGPERECARDELVGRIEQDYGDTREGRILLMILSGEAASITEAAQRIEWNHPTALAHVREHPVVRDLLRERQTA